MSALLNTHTGNGLQIELLGRFRLTHRDAVVESIGTPRLQALMAYLALHHGAQIPRRRLAFTFWPDSTEKQAFNNLRNLIYLLRRAWPPVGDVLQIEANTLQWKDETLMTLDVTTFEQHLAEAEEALQRAHEPAARAALEDAVELYRGELLPDCYDEWIFPERERLHDACIHALDRLSHLLESQRDYTSAIRHGQHLLRLDPLRETTYRRLMRLHALNRDRAQALQVYRDGARILEEELGIDPDPATRSLYDRLRSGPATPEAGPGEPSEEPAADTPLVGRRKPWKALQDRWRLAAAGHAHLVTLTGEAGIGKTRLAEELVSWTQRQGFATASAQCYAAEGQLAYAPVVEWLRAAPLQAHLDTLDPVWRRDVALLLPEFQTSASDWGDSKSPDEAWQRRRLFEALARAVLAYGRPLLLVLDDLQWCDRDTLEWMRFLLRFAPEARLLLAGTVRGDEIGPLHPLRELLLDLGRTGQTHDLALTPLDADETKALAAHVAGRALDDDTGAQLYRQTEGNPLFVVESVRAGLSFEATPAAAPAPHALPEETPTPLPPTVQAVIKRRLAQLSPEARTVAGLAAAIGRVFSIDVLTRASYMDDAALLQALDELWARHFVREHDAEYTFTHDRLREAAYAELNPLRRRLLHRRVAHALEEIHAHDLGTISASLAVHYERAGDIESAVAHYRRAARAAEQVHAHSEAIRHLQQARTLLHQLPPSPERDEQKLAVLTDLGLVLRFAEGHGAPQVGQTFRDAQVLCERTGDTDQLFAVHRGLWAFHQIRAEYDQATERGEHLQALAARLEDNDLRLEAGIARGLTRAWRGELDRARALLKSSLGLYDPDAHDEHAWRFGQSPGVTGPSVSAFVHALLGAPDRAHASLRTALERAEALAHPFSRAYALQHAALVHVVFGNPEAASRHAAELEALSRERHFAYWIGPSMVLQGWALTATGRPARGLERLHEGLQTHRDTGARFESTVWYGLLADACLSTGAIDDARGHVETALELAHTTGEHVWLAELHRIQGALLAQGGDTEAAAAPFRQALDTARKQQARSLELRAAISQSRWLHEQGDPAAACRLLARTISALPVDCDTPDLREAQALLKSWA